MGSVFNRARRKTPTLILMDAPGNQLVYKDQTLLPVPSGISIDQIDVGIPVVSNMTLVLDDATEIVLGSQLSETDGAFGKPAFINELTVSRGNQGLHITGLDTGHPVITGPGVNMKEMPGKRDSGYVLLEAGGVNAWEYDGMNRSKRPGSSAQQKPGQAVETGSGMEIPLLSTEEKNTLQAVLSIPVEDASGKGALNPLEWSNLKSQLEAAREHLIGSSQLQAAQLKTALQAQTNNLDAIKADEAKLQHLVRSMNKG